MIRTATLLLTVSSGFLVAADSTANDYWIRVQAGAWMAPLGGNFGYTNTNVPPSSIGAGEIGVDDRETNLYAEISIQLPLFLDFHFGAWDFGTSGSSQLSRDINFGDQTFTAGTTINSDVNISDFYGEIAWGLNFDLVGFSVGLAAHSMSMDSSMSSSLVQAGFDESYLIPMLAGRFHVNIFDNLGFEAVLHAIDFGLDEVDATIVDLRLQAIYRPFDMLGIIGGYRHVGLDLEFKDGNEAALLDLTLSGPFIGLLAQF